MKSRLWHLYHIEGAFWIPFKKFQTIEGPDILVVYYILPGKDTIKVESDKDADWDDKYLVKDSETKRVIIEKIFENKFAVGK